MILTTAFEMLREGGMSAVNVKTLADRLHCSTQPIYLSFESMDSLRTELAAMAVKTFEEQMLTSSGTARLYGTAYIHFARKEKELFRFLFMRQNAFSELKTILAPMMDQSISYLMERYHITWEKAHYLHDQLWVHSHGIASMIATGFCDWDDEKVQAMIIECEQSLCQKYEVQYVQ